MVHVQTNSWGGPSRVNDSFSSIPFKFIFLVLVDPDEEDEEENMSFVMSEIGN